jgi:toxin ParE1/3/4
VLRVLILPEADDDLNQAVQYYSQVANLTLAERFLDEFETACRYLAEQPDIGSLRFAHLIEGTELRTWSLTRFPFRMFYIVDGEALKILGVEHERRNITPAPLKS